MSRIDLDKVIGLCRYCEKSLGESPPPACYECTTAENRRATHIKEGDPYKKVWSSPEDEETTLLDSIKNGTLFVPTLEELARRHMSTARYLLRRARDRGRTAEGISVFNEAVFHRNMAQEYVDRHKKVLFEAR